MNSFVLTLKEGKPYNLSLDVEQAFPGSESRNLLYSDKPYTLPTKIDRGM